MLSPTEKAFLNEIRRDPNDEGARLAYSDWLEEQEDGRAALVRLEGQLARTPTSHPEHEALQEEFQALARLFDADWVAQVKRPTIENCRVPLKFQCPVQWNQLEKTEQPGVRHCPSCDKQVHYCLSLPQARANAVLDRCIAVDPRLARSPHDLDFPLLEEFAWDEGFAGQPDLVQLEMICAERDRLDREARSFRSRFGGLVGRVASKLGFSLNYDSSLKPGCSVLIRHGELQGLLGVLAQVDSSTLLATVNVKIYGEELPVEVDVRDLERQEEEEATR